MANLFFGVYFTLSLWYKLKDLTRYGAYMALIGAAITLILNFLLIPVLGYMGSAIAIFTCFFVMMILSYFWGQKFYPVPYNLKRMGTYFLIAVVIFTISLFTSSQQEIIKYSVHTILLLMFAYLVYKLEKRQLKRLFKGNN